MLFNSYGFIFVFFPSVLAAVWLARRFHRGSVRPLLVVASLVFYGWWDPRYLALLGASALGNFALLRALSGGRRKPILVAGVVGNLCLLFAFKYLDLAIEAANAVLGLQIPPAGIKLPLGISFFTFTQIAFLVDAYRNGVERVTLVNYGLFVTYFPHLVAGPILHHDEIFPQYGDLDSGRAVTRRRFVGGVCVFIAGLSKKVIVADAFGGIANPVFSSIRNGGWPGPAQCWVAAFAYALQLYFDFSGYSDMAVGLGAMIGLRLPANFRNPYRACSIADFWRRWHMTLSRFLRDYLYIPLGGSRRGEPRRYLNLMVTMLLGGLWHGANWTFAVWGLLHGIYLCANHAFGARPGKPAAASSFPGRCVAWAATFVAVVVGWVIFRADSLRTAGVMLGTMFIGSGGGSAGPGWQTLAMVAAGVGLVWVPDTLDVFAAYDVPLNSGLYGSRRTRFGALAGSLIGLLFIICAVLMEHRSEFLYFQF